MGSFEQETEQGGVCPAWKLRQRHSLCTSHSLPVSGPHSYGKEIMDRRHVQPQTIWLSVANAHCWPHSWRQNFLSAFQVPKDKKKKIESPAGKPFPKSAHDLLGVLEPLDNTWWFCGLVCIMQFFSPAGGSRMVHRWSLCVLVLEPKRNLQQTTAPFLDPVFEPKKQKRSLDAGTC